MRKKAQEEIAGFAIIIVIVSIIGLFLLSFSITRDRGEVQDYEIQSFIQSLLYYNTNCHNRVSLDIHSLIFECSGGFVCSDGRDSCIVLNSTIKDILDVGWVIDEGSFFKGYEFRIFVDDSEFLFIEEGEKTRNYKGSSQDFIYRRQKGKIHFRVYY